MAYAKFITPKLKQEFETTQKDFIFPKAKSLDLPLQTMRSQDSEERICEKGRLRLFLF